MTKPILLRALLFPLAIASLRTASLQAADGSTPLHGNRTWLRTAGPLKSSPLFELGREREGFDWFSAAPETITPQPQAAGQSLSIGPTGNGGFSYTVSSAGETWGNVYVGDGGVGSLSHSAGTLTIGTRLWLGYGVSGSGTYNLSGTGVLTTPSEYVGYSSSASSTFNQSGGTNATTALYLASSAGSTVTYNLSGGTLQARIVYGGNGTSTFNFNGGTLQATTANSTLLAGLTNTNVQAGGAFIDSHGFTATIAQSLLHDTSAGAPAGDGGLTKLGAGTLYLLNANTYVGATTLNAGTLAYANSSSSAGGGAFTLAGGSLLLNTSGTVTASSLSFTDVASSATLQAGTLQIAAGGTISGGGGLIFQGGTLKAAGALTITGGVPISIQAGGGTLDTSGGNVTSGSGFGYSGGAAGTSAGTGAFTIQGGHVLQADITSNSGWTGPVIINGSGTTLRNNGGNYTAAGSLNVGAGAFFDLNNRGVSYGGLGGAGTVLNTGGTSPLTLTLTGAGGNVFSGNIAPAGGATEAANIALVVNLNSGAVQAFSGNNTYTGATVLAGGILTVGSAGALGSTSIISFNGGTLQYSVNNQTDYSSRFSTAANQNYSVDTNGQNVTFATALTSGGSLTKLGGGTLTLMGNNTYPGGTTLAGGALNVGNAGALGTTGTLSFTGGSLQYSAVSGSDFADRFSTAGNQAYSLDTNGQNVTLSRALTSSGGSLTKLGAGTLTLTSNNSYSGATTVGAGTLAVGSGVAISGGGSLSIQTGATLALSGTGTITASGESTADDSYGGGTVNRSGGTVNQSGGTNAMSGTLTIYQGTYNLSGTGALSAGAEFIGSTSLTNNLSQGAFNQTGGTNTVGGTLTIGDNISFYPSRTTYTTYTLSGTGTLSAANEVLGTTASSSYLQGAGAGVFNQTGGTNTISDTLTIGQTTSSSGNSAVSTSSTYNLSGAGVLSAGTENLGVGTTGVFNQTGGTNTVGALNVGNALTGTYSLGGTGAVVANTETIASLSTFTQSGGTNTVNNTLTVNGVYNQTGGTNTVNGTNTVSGTFNQSNGTNTVNGTLLVNGAYNQTGGTDAVSGALSVGGGTYNLNGGTVQAGSVTNGGSSGTSTFNFNGGTLRAGGNSTSFFQGLTAANVQGSGAVIDTQGYNVTVAQNLVSGTASGTSDGGLTKLGGGTLTLAGTNTFNGPLNINAGVVAVSSESNLNAATSALTVGGGGQLLFTNSASLARTYNLGVSSLGIAAGQTLSFAGATVNNGTLAGPGTDLIANGTTFNGTRAGSGATLTQNSGTAAFNNVTLSGNSTFTQAAGATLNTAGDLITTAGATMAVSGTVNAQGGFLSGALTVNNGGTLNTSGASAPLYLDGSRGTTINAGGQLVAASGTSVELGGLLVNNGTQTGTLNVNLGGVARGTGTFGTVNVGQGGYFGANALAVGSGAPGSQQVPGLSGANGPAQTAFVGPQLAAAPGTANVASLTLGSGSVFAFNVQNAQAAAGTGYDTINVSSTLTLAAGTTPGNQITISLTSLAADGTAGAAANFDPGQNYTFLLAHTVAGVGGYDPAEFVVDASGFRNATNGGSFSVVQAGNDLDLVFTSVVPEPSTWAWLSLGVCSLLCAVRRRLRQAAA